MGEDEVPEWLPRETVCTLCWTTYHAPLDLCPDCNADTARTLT